MSTNLSSPRSGVFTLAAPVSGVLLPIEQVPDPVFAQKMVGEGVSIDPLSDQLVAPCDGEIIQLHASGHAVTLRTPDGLEVLLHIGLDTVHLRGEGFSAKVKLGDQVHTGDLLIVFDMDKIALEAKSLLTQMVIANSDVLSSFTPRTGLVSAGQDVVAEVVIGGSATTEAAVQAAGRTVTGDAVLVPNPTGLHARPAATLANQAKQYESRVLLRRGEDSANAKSLMAIMALEVGFGSKVTVVATGPDAELAVTELSASITAGLGEEGVSALDHVPSDGVPIMGTDTGAATTTGTVVEPATSSRPRSEDPHLLLGVAASPGLAVGTVLQIRKNDIQVVEQASDRHAERRRLTDALDRSTVALKALEDRLTAQADPDKAAIFAAHQELLADPDLLDIATSGIDKGKTAAYAWRAAYTMYADRLAGLRNEVLAGRANDVHDVGIRVLEELTGQRSAEPDIPPGTILIAEDLTPSDTATLDRERVVGFATVHGGASSHVAILARSLDIPAVAGVEARALEIPDGTRVVLDGATGTLRTDVTAEEVASIRERQKRAAQRRAVELRSAGEPAATTDGHTVDVVANIGGVADVVAAMPNGAEGVGLLRSEFVFLGRRSAPSEDEQCEIYKEIASNLVPGQPLVIRTLDVGGDKPLPYLPLPREENPFLGQRGIRVGLDRPDLLRAQIRAILRAGDSGAKVHMMFPMIATLAEFRAAKGMVEEERARLGVAAVPVGIMVEVPSVAVMARQFAAEVDFFSVGTNDLTQYTLAMDRGHPALAPQVDGLNPAVLGLIAQTVMAAHEAGRWVGVCGGIASDPQAVPVLVGLGVDELSVSIPAIPAVKAQIRSLSMTACRELGARALTRDSAAAVRALVPYDPYDPSDPSDQN